MKKELALLRQFLSELEGLVSAGASQDEFRSWASRWADYGVSLMNSSIEELGATNKLPTVMRLLAGFVIQMAVVLFAQSVDDPKLDVLIEATLARLKRMHNESGGDGS